jgi:hypothetical protein
MCYIFTECGGAAVSQLACRFLHLHWVRRRTHSRRGKCAAITPNVQFAGQACTADGEVDGRWT